MQAFGKSLTGKTYLQQNICTNLIHSLLLTLNDQSFPAIMVSLPVPPIITLFEPSDNIVSSLFQADCMEKPFSLPNTLAIACLVFPIKFDGNSQTDDFSCMRQLKLQSAVIHKANMKKVCSKTNLV